MPFSDEPAAGCFQALANYPHRIAESLGLTLDATFALIAEKAPNADVVVVGYPAITPNAANTPASGCFTPAVTPSGFTENSFPFTDVDTAYLHETEARLDAAIKTAAELNGATFVSTFEKTAANSACSTTEPYVNGITLEASAGTPSTPGTSLKLESPAPQRGRRRLPHRDRRRRAAGHPRTGHARADANRPHYNRDQHADADRDSRADR
ncbi:hypothetical protein ACFPRL_33475 [Pseudoclavibacter helvolus]